MTEQQIDVRQFRADALEEAARACEAKGDRYAARDKSRIFLASNMVCYEMAAEIRAMKERKE